MEYYCRQDFVKGKPMTRREAREAVFGLLFETDFHIQDTPQGIYDVSCDNRDIGEDNYVRTAYFGVTEHMAHLDAIIEHYSHGWKAYRISGISRAALRLCIWEMLYGSDIPHNVSINEALELVKKYDDRQARPFVNGVLNAAKNAIEAGEVVAETGNVSAEPQTADAGAENISDDAAVDNEQSPAETTDIAKHE